MRWKVSSNIGVNIFEKKYDLYGSYENARYIFIFDAYLITTPNRLVMPRETYSSRTIHKKPNRRLTR